MGPGSRSPRSLGRDDEEETRRSHDDKFRYILPMYHVYILASRRHGTLYIGVTNSLQKRLAEHRNGQGSSFVKAYGVHRLVYVESYDRPDEAIAREKQLKRWKRDWKIELIERENLEWRDLSDLLV
jgi:putative endonuclease